ncbi:hypothetical protein FQZ97_1200710 [compost metagenome]
MADVTCSPMNSTAMLTATIGSSVERVAAAEGPIRGEPARNAATGTSVANSASPAVPHQAGAVAGRDAPCTTAATVKVSAQPSNSMAAEANGFSWTIRWVP